MSFIKTQSLVDCNIAVYPIARRFDDRTLRKTSLIICVLVCALSCGVAGDAPKLTDQASLQGAWLAQSQSQKGINKNVSYLYVFSGDKVTFTDETGKEMKYSFRLDTTGNPRLIIIQPQEAPANSAPVSVAYQLDGHSLKIVVAPSGLRPTDISDTNDQELIIGRRKGS